MRDFLLRAFVLLGVATALLTELLSLFHWLRPWPLAIAWTLLITAAAVWTRRHPLKLRRVRWRPLEAAAGVSIAVIAAVVAFTAILSPPNSADAMAYHMPRVICWAQAGSVAFFPTPYLNQIMLQPLAEYAMLHTYLLTGGDHLVNLVAFSGFLGSILGVSAIAAALGLGARGQVFAALFCATLPNGILQASGAKNDWLLTLWLVCFVYFAVRRNAPFTGLSAGLALATKATAYLFAPPLLAAALLIGSQVPWKRIALWLVAGVLLVNAPQFVRNIGLSGSPLGFDSAQADGIFRWRNERPGWKSTISNALRNTSEQLGARSQRWNQAVYDTVLRIHHALALDPQDPDTTWPGARYEPPLSANHEANANNRWHLLLLIAAAIFAAFAGRDRWLPYAGALLAAFLLFCLYLKWQPFLARLELPLFILGAPLAAFLLERLRPALLSAALCLFLLSNARLPLLQNWTRPLTGPHSLFVTTRDDAYFNDMVQWNNRAQYLAAVDPVARSGCNLVGLDINPNQLEYPFQALLREHNPSVRFVHVNVRNPSARYAMPDARRPCVTVVIGPFAILAP